MSSFLNQYTGPNNYSFYAIPVAWTLSIIPHFYAVSLSKGKFSNVSPRGYLAEVQKKENKTALDKQYIRAEAAQQNGFENLPFFSAAIIAGNVAKLPSDTLNLFAAGYLVSRVVYNLLYINTTSESTSNLRSGAFLAGIGICFTLFIKAGNAFF